LAKSGKWICDKCRSERLRLLDEKLQNAFLQIDDLTRKNKAPEEQLRLATVGKEDDRRDTVPDVRKGEECLVQDDSIIRNVGTECTGMKVECFPGIRTEQLHRAIENRDLGNPDRVVIHVGTNDLRRTGKFSSREVLSGVLRRRDLAWRRNGAVNSRY